MYTGQIAVITTQDDWVSDFYQFIDDDTGEVINISNEDIGFDATVTISDRDGCGRCCIGLSSGDIFIADADDGPGIQWVFPHSQLSGLCSGTYKIALVVTVNGLQTTLIDGEIVIEAIR